MFLATRLLSKVMTVTASDTQYTSPAKTRTLLKAISFHNPKTNPATDVTIKKTPSGGSLTIVYENTLLPGENVRAYEHENQMLEAGDIIQFTGAGVNLDLTGISMPSR